MKKIFTLILICTFFETSSLCLAADTVFVVNPTSIRGQLLSKNISLLQALNNVQNSKLNVSMARAKLLPSLNLGVLLPALANPTFLLSSVTFLFPFLVPSNWLVLKQDKDLFESDKASFKALQLNILSNSLSLYYTFVNDQKIQNVFAEQSEILGNIYLNLKKQSDVIGNVTIEDLDMSSAQWQESKIRVSKLQELLVAERASLRTLLGLPLGSELTVEDIDLAPSDYELKSASEIADHSLEVAPEVTQLDFLIKAAKTGKFAKLFGFMSSASIAGASTNSTSPFDGLKAGGGFSFGADNLVNIQIANNNIENIKLRAEQLKQENEKTAEILVGQIIEVKDQQELSAKALTDRLSVYEGQKRQYALGLVSLQTLLQTQVLLTDSYVLNIKSDLDLKMQRLTLMRLAIDGDFLKIKGCIGTAPTGKKSIFRRDKGQSLDELCR
ncbi:MAG: TolC family protein [Bacteriovorax sp.]|nr:TolC family protein [Bacteriovorax sp.]